MQLLFLLQYNNMFKSVLCDKGPDGLWETLINSMCPGHALNLSGFIVVAIFRTFR